MKRFVVDTVPTAADAGAATGSVIEVSFAGPRGGACAVHA